jgi:hypothetical protein
VVNGIKLCDKYPINQARLLPWRREISKALIELDKLIDACMLTISMSM